MLVFEIILVLTSFKESVSARASCFSDFRFCLQAVNLKAVRNHMVNVNGEQALVQRFRLLCWSQYLSRSDEICCIICCVVFPHSLVLFVVPGVGKSSLLLRFADNTFSGKMHEHVRRHLSDLLSCLKGTDSPEMFWSQEREDGLLQLLFVMRVFLFVLYLMFIKLKKEKLSKFLRSFYFLQCRN